MIDMLASSEISIRPMSTEDIKAIEDMHERLSESSLYNRYLRSFKPSEHQLRQMVEMTVTRGAGFVATVGSQVEAIVGMAFYVIESGEETKSAEPAFLVEDAFQGSGLGRRLWDRLSGHAQCSGISEMNAYVHPRNTAMVNLFKSGGFPVRGSYDYGMVELNINLDYEIGRATRC